jgi:hypothetical protein
VFPDYGPAGNEFTGRRSSRVRRPAILINIQHSMKAFVRSAFRLGVAVTIGAGCAGPAAAQETAREIWPEIDVWVQLNPKVKLFFPLSVSKSRETEYTEALIGARVDYRFNRYVAARAGYGYIWSISDKDAPDQYTEHRPVVELSLHAFPGASIHLIDRSRGDFRFINGDYSWRYRNRLRIERTFTFTNWPPTRTLTPYAMEELGYDSRYDEFNRSRFSAGLETQFTEKVMLDVYLVRQDDTRSSVERLWALGLALNLSY